ncbi:biotin-dependent carboxyltransferase family protein [Mariniflexile aquimaris]|uniref:Biotin-dependent carboxyltransferase family protein n=1 Tax=Mariniflexile aquimaris TaxID=881009 RepID=A0ABW3BSL7_9FLAO
MVKVLNPGLYSSIQDFGRVGFQQYGVPIAGVMDQYSAALANHILGNHETAAVIEMTMTGATLQFYNDTYICVTGADMSPKLNDVLLQLNKAIKIQTGDVLSFGKIKTGFRTYVSVLGGFKSEMVMNSQSMFGGITSELKLVINDEFKYDVSNSFIERKNASIKVNNNMFLKHDIEAFQGPEYHLLSQKQQDILLNSPFSISNNNNRMAYQLQEPLENSLEPIITSGVLPGTVQLTPSGKLIILMRDCQTTGGYPRVLQLKESAINILAQKYTGQQIRFKLV